MERLALWTLLFVRVRPSHYKAGVITRSAGAGRERYEGPGGAAEVVVKTLGLVGKLMGRRCMALGEQQTGHQHHQGKKKPCLLWAGCCHAESLAESGALNRVILHAFLLFFFSLVSKY